MNDAEVLSASLYLLQDSRSGTNPFTSGDLGAPRLDVRSGTFNAPEVEVDDWNAPADALDAGCFVGSAAGVAAARGMADWWRHELRVRTLQEYHRGVTADQLSLPL